MYYEMLTIAICDMQSESIEVHCVMWTKLNQVMFRFGLRNPNFKGFMADNAHANWNDVSIMYDYRDVSMKMVDKEQSCLFHWIQ
jgi:hypothetical protein